MYYLPFIFIQTWRYSRYSVHTSLSSIKYKIYVLKTLWYAAHTKWRKTQHNHSSSIGLKMVGYWSHQYMVYIGKVAVIFSRLGSWRSYPYLLIGIGWWRGRQKSQTKSTMTTDRARPTKHRSHFCQSTHYLSIQPSAEDNRPWYRKLISPIVSFGVEIVAFIHPSCFY